MTRTPLPFRQTGVGLVTAIFLLVVLSGLGVAMITIFNSQQASIGLDVQGARAYQAARAGIEWGLFQQLRTANPCGTTSSFAMPGPATASSLNGFTVTVSCRAVDGPGGDTTLTRKVITATACNQPGNGVCPNFSQSADYVQRVLEVQL